MDFLDEEKHKLSKHAALVQEIYEDRCLHPSKNNILNCIYELQPAGLASLIHQYWNDSAALDLAYLFLRISPCSASLALSCLVHHPLLIPPYVQFSRIRRSDSLHREPCARVP